MSFRHASGRTASKYLVEIMGSGVAVFDADNDGRPDLLFVNGHRLDGPPRPTETPRLYRNLGGWRFRDVTAGSGLDRPIYGMGCAVGDFDNDGWEDLYLSAVLGPGRLYRNRGGRFEDVTRRAGLERGGRWGSGCAWLDYDRDNRLDLYVAGYVRYGSLRDDQPCYVRPGRRSYCIPRGYEGSSGVLYRNLGDGRFTDVTAAVGLHDPGQKALGVIGADLEGDGWPELIVANDTVPNRLFRNVRGRFSDAATTEGIAFSESGKARAGMGVEVGEWSPGAPPAIILTNFSHESIAFYSRDPRSGAWQDAAASLGVTAPSAPLVGFGVRLVDVDNDGLQDLVAVNGHVRDDVEELEPGERFAQPALLLHNTGRGFKDATSLAGGALTTPAVRRGLVTGDFDGDGRVDLVATTNDGPAEIWRNETVSPGHWLAVRLVGRRSNRSALGARVTVRTGSRAQTREVCSGGSYLSESERRLHFGLGASDRIDRLTIEWPSGHRDEYRQLPVDRVLTLTEGVS